MKSPVLFVLRESKDRQLLLYFIVCKLNKMKKKLTEEDLAEPKLLLEDLANIFIEKELNSL